MKTQLICSQCDAPMGFGEYEEDGVRVLVVMPCTCHASASSLEAQVKILSGQLRSLKEEVKNGTKS